ncbi:hypothetical protein [Deinococcus sp. UYEF24]
MTRLRGGRSGPPTWLWILLIIILIIAVLLLLDYLDVIPLHLI